MSNKKDVLSVLNCLGKYLTNALGRTKNAIEHAEDCEDDYGLEIALGLDFAHIDKTMEWANANFDILKELNAKRLSFAKQEFEILEKLGGYTTILEVKDEIISLCEKVDNQGHSGGSIEVFAPMLGNLIKKLVLKRPISELTGEDDEWVETSGGIFQNRRNSAVFKENGKAHYLDAIIWRNDRGACFSGSAIHDSEKIPARQGIPYFPFTPKTFYVDVDEKEGPKDYWTFTVKDVDELNRALEYYSEGARKG